MTRQDLSALGIVTTGLALFSAHFGVGGALFFRASSALIQDLSG
ncbi:MAG: hypothetical protein VB107_06915 [Aminivibrio sp.]|jgi:hypothetical protein|nr:hypothetical protein [Aminivibrio sp.]MEA4952389.1 hypothetical protein [Aminivibrio sp.]